MHANDRGTPLSTAERALVIAVGIVMLGLSLMSIVFTFAMLGPMFRLVEGLSK